MIRVQRLELGHGPGKDWQLAADKAMSDLIATYTLGKKIALDEARYQAAKPFLLALTNDKCAYCESVILNTHPGEVEHFRPKGRVREKDGKVLRVKVGDAEQEHPGYWWLAYSWSNLLPACIDCNRRRQHGEDSVAAGKADHFAVRGQRAVQPGDDLDQEDPLLLDPSWPNFDPEEHFEFLADGKIKPKTEQAAYTCELLGLNEPRETLVAERTRAYYEAKEKFSTLVNKASDLSDADLLRFTKYINAMWAGRTPHSAFARKAIEQLRQAYRDRLGWNLVLPLPE